MPPKRKRAVVKKLPILSIVPAKTENGAASLGCTGSAVLNLFFKAVRNLQPETLVQMLDASWDENALDTLRLIFQTRDCRGGKGEKALFRSSLRWLASRYPSVLEVNLKHIPFFGNWKDPLFLIGTPLESQALQLIANQLKEDLEALSSLNVAVVENKQNEEKQQQQEETGEKKQKRKKISLTLCSKWAPTERHADDKTQKAAKKIAKLLYPKSKQPLKDYRKLCLVPLRTHLRIVEQKMCSKQWSKIDYQAVPSRCMLLSKESFKKHDSDRFNKFLEDVKQGKKTIKASQVYPHELVTGYNQLDDTRELQWKSLIDAAKKVGTFPNSLVISDVSGSMSGLPMEVSVGLGLFISELCEEPFKNLVITFHETPSFFKVTGDSLYEKARQLRQAPWGGSTNFIGVFNLILEKAVKEKLPAHAMPTKIFVLSDMQFNQADMSGNFKTNHQVLKDKYKAAGYEIPTIFYWNLRANTLDFPVNAEESGAALVSGFSPSILKLLMDTGDIDPYYVLRKALDDPRYSCLTLGEGYVKNQ